MKRLFLSIICILSVVAVFGTAQASVGFVTSRAAMTGGDYVDWSTLGTTYTDVNNPASTFSNLGLSVTVSIPGGGTLSMGRRDQDDGWYGNFTFRDRLLWTRYNSGPMTITFGNPIKGAGAQIQANNMGGFTGWITALDSLNNVLGSFSRPGTSDQAADGSAIYLGILSDVYDIKSLVFDISGSSGVDFAINRVDVNAVPIPGAILLFGPGLVGIAAIRRRFKK